MPKQQIIIDKILQKIFINKIKVNKMVGQQYFCYLYIDQEGQAFIAFGLTIIVLALMIKTWRQFKEAREEGKINNTIQTTYIIILALCLLYMPQIIVSETFYWLSKTQHPPSNSTGQFISKYIFFMQFLQQILFETILLLISYNWLNNIISIFDYVKEEFRKQIILFRFIKFLIWVRLLNFGLGALFLFGGDVDGLNEIAKYILGVFILQEILITLSFLIFIALIRKNRRVISQVQKSGINKMVKTYAFLIILTIINILWNIWYLMDLLTRPQQFRYESCGIDTENSWKAYDILQMVMMIGLNMFAAVIVLILYRVNQKVQSSFIYEGSYSSSKINLSSGIEGDLLQQ